VSGHDRHDRHDRAASHEDYRELFDLAPAAYLVTDTTGTVRQASRRASRLLGTTRRFLDGAAPWLLRVRPRGGEPVTVAVSLAVARGHGRPAALLWLLLELPATLRVAAGDPD
jgi:PAS domain S-box-containing protein